MTTVPTLEGPGIRLRAPADRDFESLFAWYNDPEIVSPYDRFSVDTFDAFVSSVRSAPDDPRSLAPRFVVATRTDDRPIGLVGHYQAHAVLEYVDIWYVLGDPSERGKGFGTEAVGLLVDHVFHTVPVERVGATTDVENAPSYKLLESLGFRREGSLRLALFHHNRWHDVHVYGITRAEWSARPRKA